MEKRNVTIQSLTGGILCTASLILSHRHPAFSHPLPRGEELGVRGQSKNIDTHAALFIAPCIIVVLMLLVPVTDRGMAKEKKNEPFALLMGTCFGEQGFSMPGVKVLVAIKPDSGIKTKKKKWELVSSPRGEFAVRLPAGHNTFVIDASKEGFKPVEKTITFENDERQDVIIKLEPEPKKKQ